MKNLKQYLFVSFILIFLSFIMFFVHYLIFGQLENTIYYSLMSLCFIPINILAVTLVFEKLVERRTKLERLSKLNMLVGLFFSDIGFTLLKIIVAGDEKIQLLNLDFSDLKSSGDKLKLHDHNIKFEKIDYPKLEKLVIENRDILSNLISNENILEHETFADLLMSLMHLRDEIIFLQYKELTDDDSIHINGDICRVYKTLTAQWINYLCHLKQFYPYQYSGAIKFNPFTLNK
ncbi:hypothetical protein [Clostridium sp. Maddingley MBC34-26]|uniref:hypothetical protein n=2 Tax=unclassified Clostridium TaxID=2614128 RepID=UPI00029743F2|nr:hypothetical protein [Clostridium sp. Maddingley MBC34-26]EKQ50142.1 MAG: hypothetical protein A370_05903 [Clostridium sp. Maddingley MBC34-26]